MLLRTACRLGARVVVFAALVATFALHAEGAEPALHERIDAIFEADALGPLPPQTDDAEFVRRVSLDLNGIVPTAAEARAFLADTTADKRLRLIDRLLDHPRYARHWATTFDVLWLERRNGAAIKLAEWQEFLYQSFSENKPYHQLVRELLLADDQDPKLRPAAKFFTDRDCEPNAMTRDIGRLFFGMDLTCAQCHDHPVVDDYRIGDYYGIYAFVQRTYLHRDGKRGARGGGETAIAEKAEGEASFKSVFTGEAADRVMPRVLRGVVLVEPVFAKGQEYIVPPTNNAKPVPAFSRRAKLAELVSVRNDAFDRNIANRLWAAMMGRGLVHPVEFHHPDNPPSHPELMTLLAVEFRQHNYDIKWFLRELAQTRAYQRSCIEPRPDQMRAGTFAARLPELQAALAKCTAAIAPAEKLVEQAKKVLADTKAQVEKEATALKALQATAVAATVAADKALKEEQATTQELAKLNAAMKVDTAAVAAAQNKLDEQHLVTMKAVSVRTQADQAVLQAAVAATTPERLALLEEALEQAKQQRRYAQAAELVATNRIAEAQELVEYEKLAKTDRVAAARVWSSLLERWTAGGYLTSLKPLGPEALAMSLMQATGVVEQQEVTVTAALQKTPPPEMKQADEKSRPRIEARLVEKQTYAPLDASVATFVRLYDQIPGQDFSATINQSLFFGNGTLVSSWLSPGGRKLLSRLDPLTDPNAVAEELYLSVFSRLPSPDERAAVGDFLKGRTDRLVALQEMAWALLSSNEFRFNH